MIDMYTLAVFDKRVKLINPRFTEHRSSLRHLYAVLRNPPIMEPTTDILSAMRRMSVKKRQKYRTALQYVIDSMLQSKKPLGFKWLIPGVGGMQKFIYNMPADRDKVAIWLYKNRIKTVISIDNTGADQTKKYTVDTFADMKWYSCFLADWHAPSVTQLLRYCDLVSLRIGSGGIVTHCAGGTGRTACFLAAWALHTGRCRSAQAALKYVREDYNEHSIEIKAQYNALARFSDYMNYPASLTCDSDQLDQAGGHWNFFHGNDGMTADPGHAGSNGTPVRAVVDTMISSKGAGKSRSPYVTESPRARVQCVK